MIKRVKICDFKSIRELELVLDPVTVLVGRSGTGKSNTVQALRFLRNFLLGGHENAVNYEWGWERIVPVGEKKPKTSIEVTFSLPGEEKDYTYAIAFGCPGQQQFPSQIALRAESLAIAKDIIFSRVYTDQNRWDWQKAPDVAALPQQHPGPMISHFPSLQKVVFAYAGLSSGIGYYHFPASTLSDNIGPDQRFQFLQSVPGLSDNAHNYLNVMRGITQDFHHPNIRKSLLASLQTVNPSIASIELDSLTGPQRAIVGHTAAGRIFDLNLQQESDG
ncbi:MAG: AAA family ATPase, partial [Limisphaerales bacterium]